MGFTVGTTEGDVEGMGLGFTDGLVVAKADGTGDGREVGSGLPLDGVLNACIVLVITVEFAFGRETDDKVGKYVAF